MDDLKIQYTRERLKVFVCLTYDGGQIYQIFFSREAAERYISNRCLDAPLVIEEYMVSE